MSTISAENLREGQQILVRGKIAFSRLAQLIDGDALAASIAQAKSRGAKYPTKVPHTTINLVDAAVVAADPTNPTLEERFVHEKLYTVKSGDNAGKIGYGIDNKSSFLPTVLEQDPENPGMYRQLTLERDLAGGVDVTIVLQVFKQKDFENRGIGLQQIVLNEPVRYYKSGVDTDALAARGIVVNGGIRAIPGSESTSVGEPIHVGDTAGLPANSAADARGFAVPTPGAQGIAPTPSYAAQAFPQSAPATQPVAPAAAAAPLAQVAQVAAPAPAQQVETNEQIIARLQQQIDEQNAAQRGSGGGSPFDAAPAQVPALASAASPWDIAGTPAPAFQG